MDGSISRLNQSVTSSFTPPQSLSGAGKNQSEDIEVPQDTFERKSEPSPEKKSKRSSPAASSKASEGAKSAEPEYVILAYMDGSNNLEDCIMDDVKEMENAPASDHYKIVTQFSRYSTSPLTVAFLSESLSQAFQSKEFNSILKTLVGNDETAAQYKELMKDSYTTQRISTILLRRNPELQEKLDRVIKEKVKDASQSSRTIGDVIKDTAGQMLGQIIVNEEKLNQIAAEAEAQAQAQQGEGTVQTQGAIGSELLQIMGEPGNETPESIMANFLKVTGEFLKGEAGANKVRLFADGGPRAAETSGNARGSILFVDSPLGGKYDQPDMSGLLSSVDDVQLNKEPLWRGARRYELTHDDDPSKINSKMVKDLGYRSMAKVDSLANFIAWGMKNYPAKHYIVLMSDHGAGFLGAEEDRGDMLSLPDLKKALDKAAEKSGKKPDIVAFDACLMAQAEVAYELKDTARYLISSEEIIGGDGYPYKDILPAIDKSISEGKSDPKTIASVFIENAEKVNKKSTHTLSTIDLKQMKKVARAVDQLAADILGSKIDMEQISASFKQAQHFDLRTAPSTPYDDYRDLWDLADKLQNNPNIKSRVVKEDLKNLKAAIEKSVVSEQHEKDEDYENSHGVSVYAPRRQKSVRPTLMEEYEKTQFAKDSPNWIALIKKITNYEELLKQSEGEGKSKLTLIELPERYR